jgi:hypothetical protein
MTRHEVLSSVGATVHGLMRNSARIQTVCFKAFDQLGHLCGSARVTSLEVPGYFTKGIQDVIRELDSLRTGFARTAEEESVAKSAKELTVEAFVTHASQIVTKALEDGSRSVWSFSFAWSVPRYRRPSP